MSRIIQPLDALATPSPDLRHQTSVRPCYSSDLHRSRRGFRGSCRIVLSSPTVAGTWCRRPNDSRPSVGPWKGDGLAIPLALSPFRFVPPNSLFGLCLPRRSATGRSLPQRPPRGSRGTGGAARVNAAQLPAASDETKNSRDPRFRLDAALDVLRRWASCRGVGSPWREAAITNFTIHDLRQIFASASPCPAYPGEIAEVLGHKDAGDGQAPHPPHRCPQKGRGGAD